MSLFHDAATGTLSRQGLLSYLHIHGIDQQCDQRGEGIFGLTALCLAARNGHVDAVKLLLNQGANPDALTSDHKTALWIVTDSGMGRARAKVVELLLKYKANARYCHPDLRDGAKPLENELMHGKDPEVIQLLVEANGTTEKAERLASRLNNPAIDDAMESTRWRRQIRTATVNLISAFILFILALVDSTGIARMVNKIFHNVLADDSINDGIQDNQATDWYSKAPLPAQRCMMYPSSRTTFRSKAFTRAVGEDKNFRSWLE